MADTVAFAFVGSNTGSFVINFTCIIVFGHYIISLISGPDIKGVICIYQGHYIVFSVTAGTLHQIQWTDDGQLLTVSTLSGT